MRDFLMPSLGADMDEGKLIEWYVAPGDHVTKGQLVAVVETAKSNIDVESWIEGTVHELLLEPGETVPVGTVIARLLEPGEEPGAAPAPVPAAAPAPAPTVPGAAPAPAPAPTVEPARPRVSPAARRRAAELGIDVATVTGTGAGGAVTLADVEAATRPEIPSPADRQVEMRRAIAAAMSRSKREIPHYYLAETVCLRRATDWLTAANAARPITGRMVMAVLQLKAVALALRDFPDLNGFFVDDTYRPAPTAHVGVAISLRRGGLVAPAIHDVAARSLTDLMGALTDLVQRARAGTLRGSEITDPTITVTNLGDQGVETVFPIIQPPQVAIVGFGRIAPRPWVDDGVLGVAPTVTVSLGADHRVSDGHRGALFLAAVADLLQHPDTLEGRP